MARIAALAAMLLADAVHAQPGNPLELWYDEPATQWTEALPVGNGRLGAMVFGGPEEERLQLNEDTLWAGGPYFCTGFTTCPNSTAMRRSSAFPTLLIRRSFPGQRAWSIRAASARPARCFGREFRI